MKTYLIKKNDYPIGEARGKFKAIQYIENILVLDGENQTVCQPIWGKWQYGYLTITTKENVYTIEERK